MKLTNEQLLALAELTNYACGLSTYKSVLSKNDSIEKVWIERSNGKEIFDPTVDWNDLQLVKDAIRKRGYLYAILPVEKSTLQVAIYSKEGYRLSDVDAAIEKESESEKEAVILSALEFYDKVVKITCKWKCIKELPGILKLETVLTEIPGGAKVEGSNFSFIGEIWQTLVSEKYVEKQ